MTNHVAIEINNLTKFFKKNKALNALSLQVYNNEIFGLLGPNGSGKTTLLRILSTIMAPDQSFADAKNNQSCIISGLDLFQDQAAIRKIIGYVPQQDALYADLSAIDNLILFSTPYCFDKKEQKNRITELLHLVQLYERRHDLVRTFSGGMKKRLSIACALVHKPEVILLDEITVGLDTSLRREIWALIKEQKKSSSIVITTHYIPDAEQYCDRVALMLNGNILDCGSPQQLIENNYPASNLEEVMMIYEQKPV